MTWISLIPATLLMLQTQSQASEDARAFLDETPAREALMKQCTEMCRAYHPVTYRRCNDLAEVIEERPLAPGEDWLPIIVKAKDVRFTVAKAPAQELRAIVFDLAESLEELGGSVVAINKVQFRNMSLLVNTGDNSFRRSALRTLYRLDRELGINVAEDEVRRRVEGTSELELWRKALQLDPAEPLAPDLPTADLLYRRILLEFRILDFDCTEISRGERAVLVYWSTDHPQSGGVPEAIVVFHKDQPVYSIQVGRIHKPKTGEAEEGRESAFPRQLAYSLLTSALGE
jgi:hypothetical protein